MPCHKQSSLIIMHSKFKEAYWMLAEKMVQEVWLGKLSKFFWPFNKVTFDLFFFRAGFLHLTLCFTSPTLKSENSWWQDHPIFWHCKFLIRFTFWNHFCFMESKQSCHQKFQAPRHCVHESLCFVNLVMEKNF